MTTQNMTQNRAQKQTLDISCCHPHVLVLVRPGHKPWGMINCLGLGVGGEAWPLFLIVVQPFVFPMGKTTFQPFLCLCLGVPLPSLSVSSKTNTTQIYLHVLISLFTPDLARLQGMLQDPLTAPRGQLTEQRVQTVHDKGGGCRRVEHTLQRTGVGE